MSMKRRRALVHAALSLSASAFAGRLGKAAGIEKE
jgi:hypothetical protein